MKKCRYKSFDELPLMLTVDDVAGVLGISLAGTYELVKTEGFPHLRVGGRIIVPKEKFIAWLDEKSGGKTCEL